MHRSSVHVRLLPLWLTTRLTALATGSPGWVHTGHRSRTQEKPAGAWTAEQTVGYMLDKLAQGQFYILCPDNDVSTVRPFLRV